MRILIAAGGTAGHINPGLAAANRLIKENPDTVVRFVGTREGLETTLVTRAGYKTDYIKIHGFDRSLSVRNIKNICELPLAIGAALRIIKDFKPDVVMGTGGYVSGPVLYAAAIKKIPTIVHESNAFPGVTTRMLAGIVDTVALGVSDAEKYLKKIKNVIVTGTPVREDLLENDVGEARKRLKLDKRPYIVAFGGSLGAVGFNKTVADWIVAEVKKNRYQILMATGKNNRYEDVMRQLRACGADIENADNINICEYIYNMNDVMSAADIMICRAGASTLCELTALGKASVLVPSPYVTGNHQEHNARAVERGGGARVILEKDFTADALNSVVEELTGDSKKLLEMRNAAKSMGRVDALDALCTEINRLAKGK